jgi:hypothetical protein
MTVVGQKYGSWLVLAASGQRVVCECECGTIRTLAADGRRTSTAVSSCGCMGSKAEAQIVRDYETPSGGCVSRESGGRV